ncbi:MAG: hypothetical protein WC455_23460 [Dehalococcoidia bacterium]|jgi:hypothetical protein
MSDTFNFIQESCSHLGVFSTECTECREKAEGRCKPVTPGMAVLKEYVVCANRKKQASEDEEAAKKRMKELEPDVLAYLQDNGIKNINIDGHCIYINPDIRATFQGTPEALKLAKANGLDDAIITTINPQRASSICREFIKEDEDRPAWLDEVFSIYEGFSAKVRKS